MPHRPGHSLQQQARRVRREQILLPSAAAVSALIIAAPLLVLAAPDLIWVGIVLAALIAVTTWATTRIRRGRSTLQRLAKGRQGELDVARHLDRLERDGHRVFHDIPLGRGNIDHLIIGPKGIFTIETKDHRHANGRPPRVVFDGEHVRIDRRDPPRDIVRQAKRQAEAIRKRLDRDAQTRPPVRPVLVFPGAKVRTKWGTHSELWVLRPERLRRRLRNEPTRLGTADVERLALLLGP